MGAIGGTAAGDDRAYGVTAGAARNAVAASRADASAPDLGQKLPTEKSLKPDGTLDLGSVHTGPVDLAGFTLVTGAGRADAHPSPGWRFCYPLCDCTDRTCHPDAPDTCAGAAAITPSGTQIMLGDTSVARDDYRGSCGGAVSGPDDVYKFTLGEKSEVDALVSGFHTVMYLRTSCPDAANELECNDDWTLVNYDSRIVRRLEPGTYFLFVDG